MNKRCAGLVALLLLLGAIGIGNPGMNFGGVVEPGTTVTRIDSVKLVSPDMTFFTPGWGSHTPDDTFIFTGVPAWPETLVLRGAINGFSFLKTYVYPDTSTWYHIGSTPAGPLLKFFGTGYGGIEESNPMAEHQQRLAVSPSVVTGQMTIRLQPVGTSRPVVEIHDAVGKVVRTLDCTAGASGVATATWNREDDRGRRMPDGVYFCRYAAADVVAVRKVLVAH